MLGTGDCITGVLEKDGAKVASVIPAEGGIQWTESYAIGVGTTKHEIISKLIPYPHVWRLPLLLWQVAFFVIPLLFMAAMSFWLVRNYKLDPNFVFDNGTRMLGRWAFWDAYWITLWRVVLAGVIASAIVFTAALFLFIHADGHRDCPCRVGHALCDGDLQVAAVTDGPGVAGGGLESWVKPTGGDAACHLAILRAGHRVGLVPDCYRVV